MSEGKDRAYLTSTQIRSIFSKPFTDKNSVAYQGSSVLPLMSAAVVIVVLGALVTIVLVCRTRTYE